MGTLVEFKVPAKERASLAFSNGLSDGRTARSANSELTPYLEIGIDDYARGFRAGFFGCGNFPSRSLDGG
ncbi:MAG: hypothetical protein WBO23_17545 [Burkholderiales bacterium]